MIRSGGITHLKFHLSHSDPNFNTKKCPNVHSEVKQERRQLLDQKNKEKAKKTADIEEICVKLRGTMEGRDRHLIDDDKDKEEEDEDVYIVDPHFSRESSLDGETRFLCCWKII